LIAFEQSNIAEAGTVCHSQLTQFGTYRAQLTLEWARLSQYTGDDKYTQLVEAAVLKIMNNVSPTKRVCHLLTLHQPAPFPGEFQVGHDGKYSSGLQVFLHKALILRRGNLLEDI